MRALIAFALSIGLPVSAAACVGGGHPTPEDAHEFRYIFTAWVTAVDLLDYEGMYKERSKCEKKYGTSDPLACISVSDVTEPYLMRVVVRDKLKGTPRSIMEFKAGGCAVSVAQVHRLGLFFVWPDGRWAEPVFEDDEHFEALVKEFAKPANQPLHPTPPAAEAPPSAPGERRR